MQDVIKNSSILKTQTSTWQFHTRLTSKPTCLILYYMMRFLSQVVEVQRSQMLKNGGSACTLGKLNFFMGLSERFSWLPWTTLHLICKLKKQEVQIKAKTLAKLKFAYYCMVRHNDRQSRNLSQLQDQLFCSNSTQCHNFLGIIICVNS